MNLIIQIAVGIVLGFFLLQIVAGALEEGGWSGCGCLIGIAVVLALLYFAC